jgi:hypothetical protein
MAKALMELGANPNHQDKFGLTPRKHVTGIDHAPEALVRLVQ